jgi:hypothetical protein
MSDTTTTPAQILTAYSESLSHRIDSGFAPEAYANAARLITEHERREGVVFVPVPLDLANRLAAEHARWQAEEDRDLGTAADGRAMAEVVADLLTILDQDP